MCKFMVLPLSMRVDSLRVKYEGVQDRRHYDDCYNILAVAYTFLAVIVYNPGYCFQCYGWVLLQQYSVLVLMSLL